MDRQDWIGAEAITETGILLGWIRSVRIDDEIDIHISLVIAPVPVSWLPGIAVGLYELSNVDVISVGPGRLIVAEGTEETLNHLAVGVLERLGVVRPPWMKEGKFISPQLNSTDSRWWNDRDDDAGLSFATKPRRPSPTPTDDAAEIPFE